VARGMGWACKTSISPSVRCAYHQGTIGGVEAALSRTSRSRDLHTGRQMSHHKKCNLHIKLHSPHFIKHKCLLLSSLYSDTADLKSADLKGSWGFKSPSGHHYCQGIARQSAYQRQKRSGGGRRRGAAPRGGGGMAWQSAYQTKHTRGPAKNLAGPPGLQLVVVSTLFRSRREHPSGLHEGSCPVSWLRRRTWGWRCSTKGC
jgi:hypothetical protein